MSETLQDKITRLEAENSLYTQNGALGLYYELNRFVNGVVAYMRNQSVTSLLTASKDEDAKKFEKTMALIKNAKEHVADMAEMKKTLGLSGNEDDDKRNKPFVDGIAKTRV